MKRTRRKFTPKFKSTMAIEALKERQSLTELATQFEIHPNQISKWKREFFDNAGWAFDGVDSGDTEPSLNVDSLYSPTFKREEHFFCIIYSTGLAGSPLS